MSDSPHRVAPEPDDLPDDLPALPELPCPVCKAQDWQFQWKLLATGGSLAGVQPKVSAKRAVALVCCACGAFKVGRRAAPGEVHDNPYT